MDTGNVQTKQKTCSKLLMKKSGSLKEVWFDEAEIAQEGIRIEGPDSNLDN